jgi:hypothetical protein
MIAESKDTHYRLSILKQPAEWDDPHLRSRWAELTNRSENLTAIYSSPVWFDLLRERHKPEELALAVAYTSGGEVVGVVPILFKNHRFQYYVSRYPILTRQLRAAHVLGSVPMLPVDSRLSGQLIDLLLNAQIDCAYLDTVPADDPFLKVAIDIWKNSHLVYAPGGSRPWHLMQIPANSDEYMSQMSSRTRKLRHRAKKLAQSANGELKLARVDSEWQVKDFVADVSKVSRNSWQHEILGNRSNEADGERTWGERLAQSGLLRSYVLKAGERPCAFVVGYQFNKIFHHAETGYDREFSEHTPGTILLHMLIQDLCDHNRPAILNFGMGDGDYKRRFGNVRLEDTSIIVLRKTLSNYFLIGSHSMFRSLIQLVKRSIAKWKSISAGRTRDNKSVNPGLAHSRPLRTSVHN